MDLTPARRTALAGHLAMAIFAILVAGSFALGVRVANDIDPLALTVVRFWLATGIIAALVVLRGSARPQHFRAPWRFLALGGLFGLYFVLMFEGLKTAPSVSAAAVFTLTPILAAGFGWLLMRQRATPRLLLALTVGAMGALWVIFRADLAAFLAFGVGRGEAIYFLGCIAHAAYAAAIPRLNRGEPALVFTLGMLLGGSMLLTLAGWNEVLATDWPALPARVWIALAYLAVFASAASFVLLQYASLRLPAAKVMAYTYLTPTVVIGWEIALGGTAPPAPILIGIGLTVLALALLLRDDAPAAPRALAQ